MHPQSVSSVTKNTCSKPHCLMSSNQETDYKTQNFNFCKQWWIPARKMDQLNLCSNFLLISAYLLKWKLLQGYTIGTIATSLSTCQPGWPVQWPKCLNGNHSEIKKWNNNDGISMYWLWLYYLNYCIKYSSSSYKSYYLKIYSLTLW